MRPSSSRLTPLLLLLPLQTTTILAAPLPSCFNYFSCRQASTSQNSKIHSSIHSPLAYASRGPADVHATGGPAHLLDMLRHDLGIEEEERTRNVDYAEAREGQQHSTPASNMLRAKAHALSDSDLVAPKALIESWEEAASAREDRAAEISMAAAVFPIPTSTSPSTLPSPFTMTSHHHRSHHSNYLTTYRRIPEETTVLALALAFLTVLLILDLGERYLLHRQRASRRQGQLGGKGAIFLEEDVDDEKKKEMADANGFPVMSAEKEKRRYRDDVEVDVEDACAVVDYDSDAEVL